MKTLVKLLFLYFVFGCSSSKLPTKRLSQYQYAKSYSFKEDKLVIQLGNPLKCPLRIWVNSPNPVLSEQFNTINPILLNGERDTILTFGNVNKNTPEITFVSRLGSLEKEIKKTKLSLPFSKGKTFRVIQGNNSSHTHNTDWSRYAIDFDLSVNDTICSATNGFVVGVIDNYKHGGKGNKWKPFGNFITIYEPYSGVFTQYVHLVEKGSFVKVGDEIRQGQAIGLSGSTGQSPKQHLHFNCLIPVNNENGLKSIPITFLNGVKGTKLKRGDSVSR